MMQLVFEVFAYTTETYSRHEHFVVEMVVPSSGLSRSLSLSHVFDCQVRRYLDAGESFHWQDLLMLTEMALAALISEAYLAFLPWILGRNVSGFEVKTKFMVQKTACLVYWVYCR